MKEKYDIYGKKGTLERYLSRCIARVHRDDREVVREYIDDLDVGTSRIQKIASTLSMCSRELGKSFGELQKKEVKQYRRWLEEEADLKEWTVHDREVILGNVLVYTA